MRQTFGKPGEKLALPGIGLLLLCLTLAACGDTPAPTAAPAVQPTSQVSTTAPAGTSETTATTSPAKPSPTARAADSTTSAPADANFTPVSTQPAVPFNPTLLASSQAQVLVGTLTFDPTITAPPADPAAFPKLEYAPQPGGTPPAPSKTIRLQLDVATYSRLKSGPFPGEISRVLVVGQKVAPTAQGEEVLQVSFFEELGHEKQQIVGSLKYTAPELLFVPEAVKGASPRHLLINSALKTTVGDPAKLEGKRALLGSEKLAGLTATYYISNLELLGKGPTMTLTGTLGTYIGDAPGPTLSIGTNTSGFTIRDATTGKDYYLILAEGLAFDNISAKQIAVTGEKLVLADGKDHGGSFFISSFGK